MIINITEPDMHIYIVGNLEYSTDREESKNLNYLGHTTEKKNKNIYNIINNSKVLRNIIIYIIIDF